MWSVGWVWGAVSGFCATDGGCTIFFSTAVGRADVKDGCAVLLGVSVLSWASADCWAIRSVAPDELGSRLTMAELERSECSDTSGGCSVGFAVADGCVPDGSDTADDSKTDDCDGADSDPTDSPDTTDEGAGGNSTLGITRAVSDVGLMCINVLTVSGG